MLTVLLAAILAAIMSTADSQLLVSSSALAEDFYRALFRRQAGQRELIYVGRAAVILVAGLMAQTDRPRHFAGSRKGACSPVAPPNGRAAAAMEKAK